jgi:hypothetical protein
MEKNNENIYPENYEALKNEYQTAISLLGYHDELLWQEFGVFLIAETVLIGFLGSTLAQSPDFTSPNLLVFLGALFGFVLCIPWYSTYRHNYTYRFLL